MKEKNILLNQEQGFRPFVINLRLQKEKIEELLKTKLAENFLAVFIQITFLPNNIVHISEKQGSRSKKGVREDFCIQSEFSTWLDYESEIPLTAEEYEKNNNGFEIRISQGLRYFDLESYFFVKEDSTRQFKDDDGMIYFSIFKREYAKGGNLDERLRFEEIMTLSLPKILFRPYYEMRAFYEDEPHLAEFISKEKYQEWENKVKDLLESQGLTLFKIMSSNFHTRLSTQGYEDRIELSNGPIAISISPI